MRVFKRIIFFSFLFLVLSFIGFVIYLENAIDWVMTEERQAQVFSRIENSPKLPKSFHKTMKKYYPEISQQTLWGLFYDKIISGFTWGNKKVKTCWCKEIYTHPFANNKPFLYDWIISFEIEDRFSQKRCLDYVMFTEYFGKDVNGIKNASQFYYKKDLEDLNEKEILELSVIRIAPNRYNPFFHSKRLQKRVKEIMTKIK